MKKRTKIELLVFAVVAVLFILGLIRDMPAHQMQEPATIASAEILQSTSAATTISAAASDNSVTTEAIQTTVALTASAAESYPTDTAAETAAAETESVIPEDGSYTDRDSVALYIHTYGHLPSNYITKQEARDAGWVNTEKNLPEVAPGKSIGGDRFGNYEGLLPKKKGRSYYECDIDYDPAAGSRNAKRIIYSNDGLIYYTEDHYESFEPLYGENE